MTHHLHSIDTSPQTDTVTIIAQSIEAAMSAAHARGLDACGYVITGPVVPHQFTLASGADTTELFDGASMIAATWTRQTNQPQRSSS